MNLDNYIYRLKVLGAIKSSYFFVLATVDSINKKYLVLQTPMTYFDDDMKGIINRLFLSVKTKSDFESQCKVLLYSQDEILELKEDGTNYFKPFDRTLNEDTLSEGDTVRYNFVKYTVMGFVLNEYAQLNIPMPVLFNKERLVMDYKSLIFSKFSDDEILDRINTQFVQGKYSDYIQIPFVNSDDKKSWSEKIKLISKYTYLPYKIYISKILDKKETSFSSQDFLKEYVFSNQEENLEMIADKKPEFYQVFVNFLDTVNNTIYKNKKSISEKPEVEPEIIDFEQLMAEELDFDSLMEEQLG